MKYFILFLLLFLDISNFCSAQSTSYDSTTVVSNDEMKMFTRHRFYLNPTRIITGQYSFTYAYRFHKNNWIEGTIGYQYLPHSITKKLPVSPQGPPLIGILWADPAFGMGFQGPIAEVSYACAPKHGIRDFFNFVFSYRNLHHEAECYNEGYIHYYTYSGKKTELAGEFLFSHALGKSRSHIFMEAYIGGGLHFSFGKTTKYFDVRDENEAQGGYPFLCVLDIHDPNIVLFTERIYRGIPMLQAGFKLGFQ